MMSAISIFGENSFIFNFVGYGLVIKSLGAGAHLKRREPKKMLKDECESFYNQIRMNQLTEVLGGKIP